MTNFWHNLWTLIKPSHKKIKRLLVLVVFLELIKLIGPYFLKLIIDAIMEFGVQDIGKIFILVASMFVSNQIVSAVDYFWGKKGLSLIANIEYYLPTNAHKKMVFLSLGYHERENTGNKITRIQRGVMKIVELLGNLYWDVAPTIIQVIITTVILFIVDWRFGLVFVFFAPLFALVTYKFNKQVSPMRVQRHEDYEAAAGEMAQSIININTVKSFTQENQEVSKFKSIVNKIKESALKEFAIMMKYVFGRNLVIDLGRIFMIIFGVYLVSYNEITIGSLVFIVTISEKAFFSLFRISRLYDKIMESSEPTNKLHELSAEESDIPNPKNGIKPKKIKGDIEFVDAAFRYGRGEQRALHSVSVKIASGSITALVGPSGGGKTTLARMVYRHYDPQVGKVLLDGVSLKKYDLYAFRRFISIVPQDVDLFNASVSENIAYSNPAANFKEIKKAAQIANANEFIQNFKDGFDTMVGERGVKLSGGQKQRIGIARAILANPQILIFDEATSNLDSHSEKLIQDAMQKISKNRTMIVIAHRLSTIKSADKIIVLKQGHIVEEGTHQKLSQASGGLYRELLNLQRIGEVIDN